MAKKQRRRLYEYSAENDIRYRGPLSYVGFQILGWLCIALSVYVLMLALSVVVNPALEKSYSTPILILGFSSILSLPFLLIANFARILNNSEGYKTQLIRNGGAALALGLIPSLFFNRYVIGLITKFVSDPENVVPVLNDYFRHFQKNGFIAFNLFMDLFLCSLFMFFLTARPQRVFTGNKRYIFRSFAILPLAYEVTSIILKGQCAAGNIALSIWCYPFLTVKPPMAFLVFVILALYIKRRELHFRRHGKTHEDYEAFLQTNRNSLHFSVFLCVVMVIAAILDYFIMHFLMSAAAPSVEALESADLEKTIEYAKVAQAMGFGNASIPLLLASPFVLLFSYTRLPKNRFISLLIPFAGVVLTVLLLLEGVYQLVGSFSQKLQPIPIRQMFDRFMDVLNSLSGLAGS